MDTQTRIRMAAHTRVVCFITSRKRSRSGFIVTAPHHEPEHFKTKKAALENLLAKIRTHPVEEFRLSRPSLSTPPHEKAKL